jgi:hypothetical protein
MTRQVIVDLTVTFAKENSSWGYDRISGALSLSRLQHLRLHHWQHPKSERYPTHSNAYYIGVTGGSFSEVSCMGMPSIVPHLQAKNNDYENPFGSEIALFRTSEGGMHCESIMNESADHFEARAQPFQDQCSRPNGNVDRNHAVQTRRLRYIQYHDGTSELYDRTSVACEDHRSKVLATFASTFPKSSNELRTSNQLDRLFVFFDRYRAGAGSTSAKCRCLLG